MNNRDIRNTLADSGISPNAALILDGEYMLPTTSWVHGEFASALDSVLKSLGLSDWSEEAWDCDKFSRMAWAYAGLLWAKTQGRPQTGLAFGVVCYVSEQQGGGHAINVFIYRDDNGQAQVRFVEPQQQLGGRLVEVKLSESERNSIWSIIF